MLEVELNDIASRAPGLGSSGLIQEAIQMRLKCNQLEQI
jgi:hypothetical protein